MSLPQNVLDYKRAKAVEFAAALQNKTMALGHIATFVDDDNGEGEYRIFVDLCDFKKNVGGITAYMPPDSSFRIRAITDAIRKFCKDYAGHAVRPDLVRMEVPKRLYEVEQDESKYFIGYENPHIWLDIRVFDSPMDKPKYVAPTVRSAL